MESVRKLNVINKKGEIVRSFDLELGENIIGRSSTSTIKIEDDDKLSRQHFIIEASQNEDGTFKYLLRDNDSTNGTHVKSGKTEKKLKNNKDVHYLQNKDLITAGDKFSFELEISTLPPDEQKTTKIVAKPQIFDGKISVPVTKKGKKEHVMVACKQILGIKAERNYTCLYMEIHKEIRKENGEKAVVKTVEETLVDENLKYFEDVFEEEEVLKLKNEFYIVRIHDKYMVNLKYVKSYSREGKDGRITLNDDMHIDKKNALVVSRTYKNLIEKFFINK